MTYRIFHSDIFPCARIVIFGKNYSNSFYFGIYYFSIILLTYIYLQKTIRVYKYIYSVMVDWYKKLFKKGRWFSDHCIASRTITRKRHLAVTVYLKSKSLIFFYYLNIYPLEVLIILYCL